MGAVLRPDGCTFHVWAPFADEMFVVGDSTRPVWEGGLIRLARDGQDGPGGSSWSALLRAAYSPDAEREERERWSECTVG